MQAIAMREMELWRDKIQLRIRDRIQTSVSGAPGSFEQLKCVSISLGLQLAVADGTVHT
jgi:hypothetical protein